MGLFSTYSFDDHFLRIHRSVIAFLRHDVNILEKLTITVKLYYIETKLKQGYDSRGYFLKKQQKR